MAQIPDIDLGFTESNTKPLGPVAADPPRGVYRLKSTGCEFQNTKGWPRLEVRAEVVNCVHPIDEGSAEAGGSVRVSIFLPNGKDADKDNLSRRRLAQLWAASGRDPAKLVSDTDGKAMRLPKLVKILAGATAQGFAFDAHIIPRDPNVKGDNSQVDPLLPAEVESVKAGKLTITKAVRRKKGADDDEADDLGDAAPNQQGGTGDDDDDDEGAAPPPKAGKGKGTGASGASGTGAAGKGGKGASGASGTAGKRSNAQQILDDDDGGGAPASKGGAPANPFDDE